MQFAKIVQEHFLMHELVSIIMPCYNAEKYIAISVESVLAQSYSSWELIIVNDASTDNSQILIDKYVQQDTRIISLKNPRNIGAAHSRNLAIKKAQGIYIAFLDSDDRWLPTKLEKQIRLMKEKDIYLSYTAYYTIDEQGSILSLFNVQKQVNYYDMLKTSTIGTLTTIYNAKVLGKFYFQDIGHEDYVMKLQILKQIPYAKGINEPLAKYRIRSQSLSGNKLHTALWQWHIYRKIEKLSLIKSIYYFIHYTFHGIFKYR